MTTAEIWGSGMYNYLLERRVQGRIYSLLYWHLGLPAHQTRVIMSLRVQPDEALWDMLLSAADGGVIPKDGVGEVLAASFCCAPACPTLPSKSMWRWKFPAPSAMTTSPGPGNGPTCWPPRPALKAAPWSSDLSSRSRSGNGPRL